MDGTKPMKLKKEAAMKMKKAAMQLKKEEAAMKLMKDKESAMKQKMNMVKGPDGKMVPDFAVDGKGANDLKSSMTMKKESAMKMKKDGAAMKMGHSPKKMAKNAMKMKSPMKNEETKKSGTITKDEKGRVTRRTGDAAFDKTVQNIMNTTPGISLTEAKKLAKKQLDASKG